ncbi:hypothetical protein GCM10022222_52830 [Amycolatopsis ultiminotia]|uniref:Uncharacterized protein n=1 Tax=Amycolatopsis ultiminotia TaxID=543629 RepID=A0ABP6X997_9PSEU
MIDCRHGSFTEPVCFVVPSTVYTICLSAPLPSAFSTSVCGWRSGTASETGAADDDRGGEDGAGPVSGPEEHPARTASRATGATDNRTLVRKFMRERYRPRCGTGPPIGEDPR